MPSRDLGSKQVEKQNADFSGKTEERSKNRLSKPPLVEAVFEIKFDGMSYESFYVLMSSMKAKLVRFSEFEDLRVPPVPQELPEVSGLVRSRFFLPDRSSLYNLGTGVLSVNSLYYSSFDAFLSDIKEVVDAHIELSGLSTINRLGLRYINKFSNVANLEEMFAIGITIPPSLMGSPVDRGVQLLLKEKDDSFGLRFSSSHQNSEVILDLDNFKFEKMDYNFDQIKNWLIQAHDRIYKHFKNSLSEDLFSSLK